jgi:hypothetical protein
VEIFVAIVPFAAVVAIAVWSGIHTYRLARPKLDVAAIAPRESGNPA